jgi:hypothetical protein
MRPAPHRVVVMEENGKINYEGGMNVNYIYDQ